MLPATRWLRDLTSALLLIAVVVVCSPTAVRYWRIASTTAESSVDEVDATSRQDARLQPLREALPGQGPVGFVTDQVGVEHYYQAQYALAPRMLIPAEPVKGLELPPPPLPVEHYAAVFDDPEALARAEARLGLTRERDLGNGLFVLVRRP